MIVVRNEGNTKMAGGKFPEIDWDTVRAWCLFMSHAMESRVQLGLCKRGVGHVSRRVEHVSIHGRDRFMAPHVFRKIFGQSFGIFVIWSKSFPLGGKTPEDLGV